jgi:diacylglycerol kinase family enzyme
MITRKPVVASIVGMDGCGKSSTFRGALNTLAEHIQVVGIGAQVWSGGPDKPVRQRSDIPLSRSARIIGRFDKDPRWRRLYKNLGFIKLARRARIRDYVGAHDPPDVILTDGLPLINTGAWAVAHFYREELRGDDEGLYQALCYLAGEQRIPLRELPRYLRRARQLALVNLLRLSCFRPPDLIFLLDLDPAVAMRRIRARGKALQSHETEAFLGELGRGYVRVCELYQERCGIPVTTIRADKVCLERAVQIVAEQVLEHVLAESGGEPNDRPQPGSIEVIVTTISGSIQDQRKVGQIGPEFRSRTSRPVRVNAADSHDQARSITHEIVARGGRTIVSAGGAGTFNAALEGAHLNGAVPPDVRLAFLRKGSADLIGKALGIPDQLPAAVEAILQGIQSNWLIPADILAVEATGLDGAVQSRHLVGFGGMGLLGEVPRFTESRWIKLYKGVLGWLLGDLGPFYVGLVLAAGWWQLQRLLGRVPPLSLTLDDEEIAAETWSAVVLINGDLGDEFPLGRGLLLGSKSFRIIALRYRGVREALRQLKSVQDGTILEQPERYGAVVRTVRCLVVRPATPCPYMVNVDGGGMLARGDVQISVSGRVSLVSGRKLQSNAEEGQGGMENIGQLLENAAREHGSRVASRHVCGEAA